MNRERKVGCFEKGNYSRVCPFDYNPFRLWSADERISMVRKAPCGYSASGVSRSGLNLVRKHHEKYCLPLPDFGKGSFTSHVLGEDGLLPKNTHPVSSYLKRNHSLPFFVMPASLTRRLLNYTFFIVISTLFLLDVRLKSSPLVFCLGNHPSQVVS